MGAHVGAYHVETQEGGACLLASLCPCHGNACRVIVALTATQRMYPIYYKAGTAASAVSYSSRHTAVAYVAQFLQSGSSRTLWFRRVTLPSCIPSISIVATSLSKSTPLVLSLGAARNAEGIAVCRPSGDGHLPASPGNAKRRAVLCQHQRNQYNVKARVRSRHAYM